jgi:hypothetical protein
VSKQIFRALIGLAATATLVAPVAVAAPAGAAGSVRSAVSLAGPSSGPYGSRIALTGTLWRYGTTTRIAGHTVVLQRSVHGRNTWGNLTSARTSSTGRFTFGVTLNGVYDYRAVYAGSGTYTSAVSGKVFPAVLRTVLFDTIRTVDPNAGEGNGVGSLRATGRVYPVLPKGSVVYLQRYNSGARAWSTIGLTRTTGSATVSIGANVRGSIGSYRLLTPARAPYYGGSSRSVGFAHYAWRGIFRKPVLNAGGIKDPWFELYTLSESPNRSAGYGGADMGGLSWIDVNTAGCLVMDLFGLNYSEPPDWTYVRIGALANGKYLRYVRLSPDQEEWMENIRIAGHSRVRIEIRDVGYYGSPLGQIVGWVLCNN